MAQRVRVTAGGDIVVESVSDGSGGQFIVETPSAKLVFPVLTNMSSSIASDVNRSIYPKYSGSIQLAGSTPVLFTYAGIVAGERVSTSYTILSGTTLGYTQNILSGVGLEITGSSDNKSTVFVQIG